MIKLPKLNLQFFAGGDDDSGGADDYQVNSIADLDSLLDGGNDDDKGGADGDDDSDDDGDDSDDLDDSTDDTDDQDGDDGSDNSDDLDGDDDQDGDDDGDDTDDEPQTKPKKQDKANGKDHKAFAAMRSENAGLRNEISAMKDTLKQIALGLGMDAEDDNLLGSLNNVALKGRAKREKVSESELKMSQELNAYKAKDIKDHTLSQVQYIKDTYGATDSDIATFIKDVAASAGNPFQQKMELSAMYVQKNLDKIMSDREAKAVEKALKRDDAADKHSGKSKKSGKKDSGKKQINTMDELDNYLNKLGK